MKNGRILNVLLGFRMQHGPILAPTWSQFGPCWLNFGGQLGAKLAPSWARTHMILYVFHMIVYVFYMILYGFYMVLLVFYMVLYGFYMVLLDFFGIAGRTFEFPVEPSKFKTTGHPKNEVPPPKNHIRTK